MQICRYFSKIILLVSIISNAETVDLCFADNRCSLNSNLSKIWAFESLYTDLAADLVGSLSIRKPLKIAVVDSGYEMAEPNVLSNVEVRPGVSGVSDLNIDENGHGTAVLKH